ncbi:MAG: MTH1187 family thiamine-binding protein [bacterium]
MLVQVAIFPTGTRSASISADVSKVIDIIDKSGLPYKLSAMSTIIEGNWDRVMKVINKARLMLRRRHSRVYIVITIDDRKGARNRLTGKVKSIEKRLRREVNK